MWFAPWTLKEFIKSLFVGDGRGIGAGFACFLILLVALLAICGEEFRDQEEPMQLAVRVPDEIVERLDQYVDNIRYRSRAHLITFILADWLDEQEEKK